MIFPINLYAIVVLIENEIKEYRLFKYSPFLDRHSVYQMILTTTL